MVKPNKGGKASIVATNGASSAQIDVQQPENPAAPASVHKEDKVEVSLPVPPQSTVNVAGTSVTLSQPSQLVVKQESKTGSTVGPAFEDTTKKDAVKFANMEKVQWAGLALIVAGLAMFTPWVRPLIGSTTTAMLTIGVGFALIFLAHSLVGHETLVIVCSLGGIVAYYFVHRHGKLQGFVDANKNGIPDHLEAR